jgi:signal transduction histidine kinase
MRPTSKSAGLVPRALAISLGLVAAEPQHACRIRGAQIAAIIRLSPLAMVATSLIATILLVSLHDAGMLSRKMIAWACIVGVVVLRHSRSWLRLYCGGRAGRAASRKAIWRSVGHGGLFGVLWGTVPVLVGPGGPPSIYLMVGCITAGMICAGGFMLATVPLAGGLFVATMLAGATYSILAQTSGSAEYGLLALLWVYGAVVITCLCWNAHLFVEHFLAVARLETEIEARERAQAEVAHSQRMSALGALAGGVAHDFNNILQSITGNATLVARRAEDSQQSRQLAGHILDAAERGGAISRRLLAFARQDLLSAEPVDVGAILHSAAELLEHTLHRSISLAVCAPPDLPMVLADKAQLETVLVNLAANARDSMPRGGSLSFEAVAEAIPAPRADPPLERGCYVRISVADNGAGMEPHILARAAEPFFTTKPKGKGTGLGLSMAKGFAEQSGGALAIVSERGIGTIVTLWLPQTQERLPARRHVFMPPQSVTPARRLLVVEDDADVRDSLVRTLEDAGFDAIGVANAMVARNLIERGLDIDLLVTDYSMPGLTGTDLLQELQLKRPGLPAILLTGHVDEVSMPFNANFVLLQKPVHPQQLIHHVWQSLAAQMVD